MTQAAARRRRFRPWGRGWRAPLADLAAFAFPQRCPACGAPSAASMLLCGPCRSERPRVPFELCARCLRRGREPVGCRAHAGFGVHAAWLYDEPARAFVHALKFGGRPRLAAAVGGALAEALPPARFDLIVAVPLHPLRGRLRGYNQAAVLGGAAAGALGVPFIEGGLERVRRTGAQARLPGASRRANPAGAFRTPWPERLRGRSVLIVDDVMTTGATMEACLEALGAAGARPHGLVLAWAQ